MTIAATLHHHILIRWRTCVRVFPQQMLSKRRWGGAKQVGWAGKTSQNHNKAKMAHTNTRNIPAGKSFRSENPPHVACIGALVFILGENTNTNP